MRLSFPDRGQRAARSYPICEPIRVISSSENQRAAGGARIVEEKDRRRDLGITRRIVEGCHTVKPLHRIEGFLQIGKALRRGR